MASTIRRTLLLCHQPDSVRCRAEELLSSQCGTSAQEESKEERTERGGGGDPPSFRQDCTDVIIHLIILAVSKERIISNQIIYWALDRPYFRSNSFTAPPFQLKLSGRGLVLPPPLAVKVAYL